MYPISALSTTTTAVMSTKVTSKQATVSTLNAALQVSPGGEYAQVDRRDRRTDAYVCFVNFEEINSQMNSVRRVEDSWNSLFRFHVRLTPIRFGAKIRRKYRLNY